MHQVAAALAAAWRDGGRNRHSRPRRLGNARDIAYIGQIDDDLADLIAELRQADPGANSR